MEKLSKNSKNLLKDYLIKKGLTKNLPDRPGVYIFKDKDKKHIYIGKAKSLKNRVSSYFSNKLLPKTALMIKEAKYISTIAVSNEFEALILEAALIRRDMPKYNIQSKDDKSPLYILITKEEYPRVVIIRKTDINYYKSKKVFGPFTSSIVVKKVLKKLRRIFPFSTHKIGKRPCIYSQIGLCKPCPNQILKSNEKESLKRQYLVNIKNLTKTLSGNLAIVKNDLERQMRIFSKNEDFESAQEVKNQMRQIDYISTPQIDTFSYLENPNFLTDLREKEINDLKEVLKPFFKIKTLKRIECFDVAHLGGSFPTASMVTFIDGESDKKYYRHFKINIKLLGDTDRMKEVLERRMKHISDWGSPDLIVVDGGKPQVSTAVSVIKKIPVVGVAKRFEMLVVKKGTRFTEIRLKPPALYVLQRMRDEAHRFSRKLHHRQISKLFDKRVK